MKNHLMILLCWFGVVQFVLSTDQKAPSSDSTLPKGLPILDNGFVKVGIDLSKGGSITWLSWNGYPKNSVNSADPGRLIQQSYYAGRSLDRTTEGQSKSWSPWTWNPIQGGGVGSWARVSEFKRMENQVLYTESVPKLWDMPNEEASAVMRQWTRFEPDMPNVLVVQCELICRREPEDRWGPGIMRHQEVPACYFTRNFDEFRSYLGDGQWREVFQEPGPPWGRTTPPFKAMAAFAPNGQAIAIFSPTAGEPWNFGPHGRGRTDDPNAGPCVHIAPVSTVKMGPKSIFSYRYWLIVGSEKECSESLDKLWRLHSTETALFKNQD